MNIFSDDKVYGGEYVMLEGYPRDFSSEELASFEEVAEIHQGSYHKCVHLFKKGFQGRYVIKDLSRDSEPLAIVGSKVNIHNLRVLAMKKPDDAPTVKPVVRISIK